MHLSNRLRQARFLILFLALATAAGGGLARSAGAQPPGEDKKKSGEIDDLKKKLRLLQEQGVAVRRQMAELIEQLDKWRGETARARAEAERQALMARAAERQRTRDNFRRTREMLD